MEYLVGGNLTFLPQCIVSLYRGSFQFSQNICKIITEVHEKNQFRKTNFAIISMHETCLLLLSFFYSFIWHIYLNWLSACGFFFDYYAHAPPKCHVHVPSDFFYSGKETDSKNFHSKIKSVFFKGHHNTNTPVKWERNIITI